MKDSVVDFQRTDSGIYLPNTIDTPPSLRGDAASLRLRPSPFRNEIHALKISSGVNLLSGLRQACRECNLSTDILRHAVVTVDGIPVARGAWKSRLVRDGEFVSVAVPLRGGGGGGKNPLATVLQIVVSIVAIAVSVYFPPAIGLVGATATFVGAVSGAAVMIGGSLLINAIAPASTPKLGGINTESEQAARVWSIDGTQNRLDPYGAYPLVLGKVRWAPRLAAPPYMVLNGNDQYVRYLYVVSMGNVLVEEPRIGDTPLQNYRFAQYNVYRGWTGQKIQFFERASIESSFSIVLKREYGWISRTTEPDTEECQIFINFPNGLKAVDKKGKSLNHTVNIGVRYRKVGVSRWTPISDQTFTGKTFTALRRGIRFTFPEPGQYQVAVNRTTIDSDPNSTDPTIRDEVIWTGMQSWQPSPPIKYSGRPMTLVSLQLMATDQLSGHIEEFNVRATSVAPTWNGYEWQEGKTTANPAGLALMLSTTKVTGKPAAMSEMDLDAFSGFWDWCAAYGWEYNAVITSRTTAGELLHNVLASGRGSYAHNGKHSVVWDDPDAPVVEMLTPRNTWGFQANKNFLDEPIHALRMRFLNSDIGFQEDERIVYADGFSEDNATNIIEWEQDGVTDPDLIWKHGRLRLAEMRLRPEIYTMHVEAESTTLQRGNRVRSQHDVALWGILSARVMGRIYEEETEEGETPEYALRVIGIRIVGHGRPRLSPTQ